MKVELSSKVLENAVKSLEIWGGNELYMSYKMGDMQDVVSEFQDGLIKEVLKNIDTLARELWVDHEGRFVVVAKIFKASVMDVSRCVVTRIVVQAFGKTKTGSLGKLDVLRRYLAPKQKGLLGVTALYRAHV